MVSIPLREDGDPPFSIPLVEVKGGLFIFAEVRG
jgi:hypothetical protein